MMKRMWKNEKGFTLMEIIIVIVILGILALLAIPRLLGFTEQAELANDKEYAAVVARAAELHWATLDATTRAATTTIDLTVIDTSGKGLVDTQLNSLQYFPGATADVDIDFVTGGVARITISDTSVTGDLIYDTSGGYSELPTAK